MTEVVRLFSSPYMDDGQMNACMSTGTVTVFMSPKIALGFADRQMDFVTRAARQTPFSTIAEVINWDCDPQQQSSL